jgi:SMODS and SLOG-associating 2TM effector domain 1/Protein of unknown function (DUF4231)/SLOG in TRPM, prokaryote
MSEGLAALLGQAAQESDRPPRLLGVLSPGAASPDSNHSSVIRMPKEWIDSAKGRFQIAMSIAEIDQAMKKPVIALLIGGTEEDKATAVRCVRRSWPLLVFKGTGALADDLLSAKDAVNAGRELDKITDPSIREIVDIGTVRQIDIAGDTDTLKRLLMSPVQKPGDILEDAWSRYDDLDLAAVEKQRIFRRTQGTILILTVLAALIAILVKTAQTYQLLAPHDSRLQPYGTQIQQTYSILHIIMIVIPITISFLVALNARFREGNKWILLRAAAESIKQNIFRYRTRSGLYCDDRPSTISAPERLASAVADITSNLMQSEVNRTNLPKRVVTSPDRMRFLTPDEYIQERVQDQISYLVPKTQRLERQLKKLQIWILGAGALGTLLAAIRLDVWVAVTTAFAAALTNKLELEQVENSLVQYNIAIMNIQNIRSWWMGLSPWEKTRQKNIDLLVDQTETVLDHELSGWVQKVQSALDKLTEKESDADTAKASEKKS